MIVRTIGNVTDPWEPLFQLCICITTRNNPRNITDHFGEILFWEISESQTHQSLKNLNMGSSLNQNHETEILVYSIHAKELRKTKLVLMSNSTRGIHVGAAETNPPTQRDFRQIGQHCHVFVIIPESFS